MLLRLSVALLAILGALFFAAPEGPVPSRADLAALRAERQRTVQLTLPDGPAQPAPERASARSEAVDGAPETPPSEPSADAGLPDASPVEVPPAEAPPATVPEVAPGTQPERAPASEPAATAAPQDGAAPEPAPPAAPATSPAAPEQPAAAPEPAPQLLYVTGSRVNLRAGPSTQNEVRGQVVRGQAVELVDRLDNGWVEIRVDGVAGTVFMSGDFLSETP